MRQLVSGFTIALMLLAASSAAAQTADLSVEVDPLHRGSIVDVVITVSNAGPDAVFNTDVAIQFDTDVLSITRSDDGCSASSIGLTCSFSSLDEPLLDVGEELSVGVTFDASAEPADVTVTVASGSNDPSPGNDTATFSVDRTETVGDAGTGSEGDAGSSGDGGADQSTQPADEGCCATAAPNRTPTLAVLIGLLCVGIRRRVAFS